MQYILDLIKEGEHQRLDFKFAVNDMRKIAKTLSAFANTEGGRLLIGVKDNGKIKGCRPEEEKHMLEFAAEKYCSPKVDISFDTHTVERNFVLEVTVGEGKNKPYLAIDQSKQKTAYSRVYDKVIPMNPVVYKSLKKTKKENNFEYTDTEKNILSFIAGNQGVEFDEIKTASGVSKNRTEWILAEFYNFGVIDIRYTDKKWKYFTV